MYFFFNDTATTEIYTLSLHDALPICGDAQRPLPPVGLGDVRSLDRLRSVRPPLQPLREVREMHLEGLDRKSTRLNSSHDQISYAVFCLKKKIHPPWQFA